MNLNFQVLKKDILIFFSLWHWIFKGYVVPEKVNDNQSIWLCRLDFDRVSPKVGIQRIRIKLLYHQAYRYKPELSDPRFNAPHRVFYRITAACNLVLRSGTVHFISWLLLALKKESTALRWISKVFLRYFKL